MDPVFRSVVVICLSILFASAATHKINNRSLFYNQLAAYGLLPRNVVGLGVLVVPLVELSLATALLVPFLTDLALVGSSMLLAFYAIVMVTTIVRGKTKIDCGCSGANGTSEVSYALVARNLLICFLALAASRHFVDRVLSFGDWGLSLLMSFTFIALYQAANQLMANQPQLKLFRTR
jgi:methylamine utilization protein MauE